MRRSPLFLLVLVCAIVAGVALVAPSWSDLGGAAPRTRFTDGHLLGAALWGEAIARGEAPGLHTPLVGWPAGADLRPLLWPSALLAALVGPALAVTATFSLAPALNVVSGILLGRVLGRSVAGCALLGGTLALHPWVVETLLNGQVEQSLLGGALLQLAAAIWAADGRWAAPGERSRGADAPSAEPSSASASATGPATGPAAATPAAGTPAAATPAAGTGGALRLAARLAVPAVVTTLVGWAAPHMALAGAVLVGLWALGAIGAAARTGPAAPTGPAATHTAAAAPDGAAPTGPAATHTAAAAPDGAARTGPAAPTGTSTPDGPAATPTGPATPIGAATPTGPAARPGAAARTAAAWAPVLVGVALGALAVQAYHGPAFAPGAHVFAPKGSEGRPTALADLPEVATLAGLVLPPAPRPGVPVYHPTWLGFCLLGAAAWGLLADRRDGARAGATRAIVIAAVFVVLALGPNLPLGPATLPLPWSAIAALAPSVAKSMSAYRMIAGAVIALAIAASAAPRDTRRGLVATLVVLALAFAEGPLAATRALPLPAQPVPVDASRAALARGAGPVLDLPLVGPDCPAGAGHYLLEAAATGRPAPLLFTDPRAGYASIPDLVPKLRRAWARHDCAARLPEVLAELPFTTVVLHRHDPDCPVQPRVAACLTAALGPGETGAPPTASDPTAARSPGAPPRPGAAPTPGSATPASPSSQPAAGASTPSAAAGALGMPPSAAAPSDAAPQKPSDPSAGAAVTWWDLR